MENLPTTTMQALYDEMKEVLAFFSLRFADMDKVQVAFEPTTEGVKVVYSVDGRSITTHYLR